MAFLRNHTVNLLNLHYGIQALAQGMGGLFFLVFLLRVGLSVTAVLCAVAVILAGRFVVRPSVLVLAKRWGLKTMVIFGTLCIAFQYPMLVAVHGLGWSLLALCLISSLGDSFYWPSYHAYFASLGDSELRGHQIGAREAFAAVISIVAPLIGAWTLLAFGPHIAFGLVGLFQLLAAIPFFGTPNVMVQQTALGAFRVAREGVLIFAAEGWIAAMFVVVWQLALFRSLGESYTTYGGAMALSAFIGAAVGMLLGRYIDAGHGKRAALIAYTVVSAVAVLRAASLGVPWLAISANALGALAACLQVPALMTALYNLAKASPCALRFHIAAEGGWDAGCAAGCLTAAGLAASGVSLAVGLILTLFGAAASGLLLRRYYERSGAAIEPLPLSVAAPSVS
jgi:hypothetical protein